MARIEINPDLWKAFCKGMADGTLAGCAVIALGLLLFFCIGCASSKDNEFIIGAEIIGPPGWYQFCIDNTEECK